MSRQFDDAMDTIADAKFAEAVADALGISYADLDDIEWWVEDNITEDGMVVGHDFYVGDETDEDFLERFPDLRDGSSIRIGPISVDEADDETDPYEY